MKLSTRFLRASAVALAFCACGRSDAQNTIANYAVQNAAGGNAVCRFEPKAERDALMTAGVTLDKQRFARVANAFIDCVDKAMSTHSANARGANTEAVQEAKKFIAAFLDDPFKEMPVAFREFADEVGLRNVKAGWAVLSVGDVEFEFKNGNPEPKCVPEMAVAIAANIDLEKVVAFLKRKMAEDKTNDAAVEEKQLAGERAWQIVPTTEAAVKKAAAMKLSPCFTSLDGQLVLLASTTAALEKQVLLYRKGMGEGRLLRDFRPANGDLVCLGVKDIGAFVKKCLPNPEEQMAPIKAVIPNGDKIFLGLGDATVRLSETPAGNISFSLKVAAASAEDADTLRSLLKMMVMMGSAQLGQNPDVPRQFVESLQRWKIGGTGTLIEASHDDVLSMVAGIVNFALQSQTPGKSTRKAPVQRDLDGLD